MATSSHPTRPSSSGRHRRRRPAVLAIAGLALLGGVSAVLIGRGERQAAADASGPPAFSALTNCPTQQYPPNGYTGSYIDHTVPANVQANLGSGKLGYMVPFRGTIGSQLGVDGATKSNDGGELVVPSANPNQPAVIVPHIYGVVCGLIGLPQLNGVVFSSDVKLASVNAYLGSNPQAKQAYPDAIEALPLSVAFGTLTAGVDQTPAHNGGLDVSLSGSTSATISLDGTPGATPNALGTVCPLNLPSISFSTTNSVTVNGVPVSGQPVTGPVENGQAMVVSSGFAVPAIATSATCPAVVAQAVNKLLGLPIPAGRAVFIAPFTFDFEINQ